MIDAALAFSALAVLFRVAAFSAMLPAFGETSIPVRIKLAIAVSMTLIVLPSVTLPRGLSEMSAFDMVVIAMLEVSIGLALALLLRVFLFAIQITGSIAAQSTSLSQILGTAGVEPLPAVGHVLTMAALTLSMLWGLHVAAVSFIITSYSWMPFGAVPDLAVLVEMASGQIAYGFQLAFTMAAPFYILSLLYNLTLGVINRAMPQLMVAFVGAPVITFGALVLLAISAPLILSVWVKAYFGFMAMPGVL